MKSTAAETTFKFVLGALMGIGFGWAFLDAIREAPVVLGTLWVLGTLLAGFLGVRLFNVSGKFPLARKGEQHRLDPAGEVILVLGIASLVLTVWLLAKLG